MRQFRVPTPGRLCATERMFHSSNLSGTENGPGADRVGQLLMPVGRATSAAQPGEAGGCFWDR